MCPKQKFNHEHPENQIDHSGRHDYKWYISSECPNGGGDKCKYTSSCADCDYGMVSGKIE